MAVAIPLPPPLIVLVEDIVEVSKSSTVVVPPVTVTVVKTVLTRYGSVWVTLISLTMVETMVVDAVVVALLVLMSATVVMMGYLFTTFVHAAEIETGSESSSAGGRFCLR